MNQMIKLLTFPGIYYSIAVMVLFLLVVLLLFMELSTKKKMKKLLIKYRTFMSGKDALTLEESIFSRFEQVDKLWEYNKSNEKEISDIQKNMRYAYQKTGLVKYDAYDGMGGQLSFVLAMLEKENNGFIINSIHNKEGCYTYMKKVTGGMTKVAISKEEEDALKQAMYGEQSCTTI